MHFIQALLLYLVIYIYLKELLKAAPASSLRSSMQSSSELHEIELHAVESINDLHCTNSNLEVAKPYSDQNQTRSSGREVSVNGLVEPGQGEQALTHLFHPHHESQDHCQCSCICCQPTCRDHVFFAVVILLVSITIIIGLFMVCYMGKMNKELKEMSSYLDALDQSVKEMKFSSYLLQNQMNFTENINTINNT